MNYISKLINTRKLLLILMIVWVISSIFIGTTNVFAQGNPDLNKDLLDISKDFGTKLNNPAFRQPGCVDKEGKPLTGVKALNCGLGEAVLKSEEVEKIGNQTPEYLFGKVIQSAMTFLGVIMLVLFIYAGILYMVGVKGGSDANITKAKDVLKWTVAGSVILFGSYAIVNAIVTVLATQFVN